MFRVGFGFDSHRFDEGKSSLRLGGIDIQDSRGLCGHSDSDVLLHAIADALLGAISEPDIGELFPPSDEKYKDKDSGWFVKEAFERLKKSGWSISNLDSTVVADEPRLSPYKEKMQKSISALLGVSPSAVSVKAKTTEGFSPGKDGIMAYAVVLIMKKA